MIPVTVFTGFLGAGKTTILNQIFQTITDKVVLIKNEFGQVAVDSSLSAVQTFEFLNGCLCCVLVGQMEDSLREAMALTPTRIFIEASGSAFPAGIALQIKQVDGLFLDAIITVVDCLNFTGYEDTSYTAKLQAKYTDMILLSKHELATEREIDNVIEHLNVLNTDTPKMRWDPSQMPVLCGFTRDWAMEMY
jgi:G3E family GTPase